MDGPYERFSADRVIEGVRDLLAAIPPVGQGLPNTPRARATKLVAEIRKAIARLEEFTREMDPVKQPPIVLDPDQPEVLGRLIGETMLEQPRRGLAELDAFDGSGVDALYDKGDHAAYAPIRNTDTPIDAGKADPPTPLAATPVDQGTKLHGRLRDHVRAISAATNLRIEDFECRFLVVKSGLQKAAEDFLLNDLKPVWNQALCKGFGKHGDAHETRANTRSEWDTLHPGRSWATREGNTIHPKSPEDILRDIAGHFARNPTQR